MPILSIWIAALRSIRAAYALDQRAQTWNNEDRRCTMLRTMFATSDTRVATLLRVMLGIVMFAHGAQSMFGWFGGPGLGTSIAIGTEMMGLPAIISILMSVALVFGGL